MLFFPLLDRQWRLTDFQRTPLHYALWLVLLLTAVTLLIWQPQHLGYALATLLTSALPAPRLLHDAPAGDSLGAWLAMD
jgi:hypothetical protein